MKYSLTSITMLFRRLAAALEIYYMDLIPNLLQYQQYYYKNEYAVSRFKRCFLASGEYVQCKHILISHIQLISLQKSSVISILCCLQLFIDFISTVGLQEAKTTVKLYFKVLVGTNVVELVCIQCYSTIHRYSEMIRF